MPVKDTKSLSAMDPFTSSSIGAHINLINYQNLKYVKPNDYHVNFLES